MANLTRTTTNSQWKHIGNVRHGVQTAPNRVEFDADVDASNSNVTKINQGTIVSLNANGKYICGCASGTGTEANHPVPYMSLKNVFDPDVTTGKANVGMTGYGVNTTYSAVGGRITAIPVTCGYELETTEYDTSDSFAINDGLTVGTTTKIGLVKKAAVGPGRSAVYIGFVSKAPANDYFGNKRIAFQTCFIPAMGIA